jgi:hypothetical protein
VENILTVKKRFLKKEYFCNHLSSCSICFLMINRMSVMVKFQMEGRDSLDLVNSSDGIGECVMSNLSKKFELKREGKCPFCEKFVEFKTLRDELSRREFRISGLCQACQDRVYGA